MHSFLIHVHRIHLEPVFVEGSIPETAFNVVKEQKYCGEVKVALTFNPEVFSFKKVTIIDN